MCPTPESELNAIVPVQPQLLQQQCGLGTSHIVWGHFLYQFELAVSGFCWKSVDRDRLENLNPDKCLRRFLAFGGSPWIVEVERVKGTSRRTQIFD
jgi:hypothetical protein